MQSSNDQSIPADVEGLTLDQMEDVTGGSAGEGLLAFMNYLRRANNSATNQLLDLIYEQRRKGMGANELVQFLKEGQFPGYSIVSTFMHAHPGIFD